MRKPQRQLARESRHRSPEGVVGRNGSQHKRRSHHRKNDERFPPPLGYGNLRAKKFGRAHREKSK